MTDNEKAKNSTDIEWLKGAFTDFRTEVVATLGEIQNSIKDSDKQSREQYNELRTELSRLDKDFAVFKTKMMTAATFVSLIVSFFVSVAMVFLNKML